MKNNIEKLTKVGDTYNHDVKEIIKEVYTINFFDKTVYRQEFDTEDLTARYETKVGTGQQKKLFVAQFSAPKNTYSQN